MLSQYSETMTGIVYLKQRLIFNALLYLQQQLCPTVVKLFNILKHYLIIKDDIWWYDI